MVNLFPFAALRRELARWQKTGKQAVFWIRDDDATTMSPEFENLLALQEAYDLPMAISVIPKWAGLRLPAVMKDHPGLTVLQHGWSHENHAPAGQGHSEFPANRPAGEVQKDLIMGQRRLEVLYGEQFVKGFVPPWNHIAPEHMDLFADYEFISGRECMQNAPDMQTLHVHVDVLRWGAKIRFRGTKKIIRKLCSELRSRRENDQYHAPIGLQLHHLVMDRATWRFVDKLMSVLAVNPAVRFADIREILAIPANVKPQSVTGSDENVIAFKRKIAR